MSKALINQYYNNLDRSIQFGKSLNETSIRNHFWILLNDYARKQNYEVVTEISCMGTKGKKMYSDGILKNLFSLDIGLWESKDEKDTIDDEIDAKLKKGYPFTNILFEDTQTAVLFQHDEEITRQYDKNDNILKEELIKLEKFIIRRFITKKENKSYNKICKEFIKKKELINDYINEISNNELLKGLENISNKDATLLLFWVELYRRYNDSKQAVKELKFNYSLEHIMPQKWEEHWNTIDIVDNNSNLIIDKELAAKERNLKIYFIGNMTLLNSSLNTSLRNYPFNQKIEGHGKKKGIRYYSELFITKEIIDSYNNGDKIWNENKIVNRTKNIGFEILQMW